MNDERIGRLITRIRAFEQGDARPVQDPEAAVEARDLLSQAAGAEGGLSFEVARLVAWLHWCRHRALPEGQDEGDLRTAMGLFTLIFQEDQSAVPRAVREYLTTDGYKIDAGRLAAFATGLLKRVASRDDPAALTHAIAALTAALSATSDEHCDRTGLLSDLGVALSFRFERTSAITDLDEAVAVTRDAVAATPDGHPERAKYLSNLGNHLRMQFEEGGAITDLDEAISVGQQAVTATPDGHLDRAAYLSSLSLALRARFDRTGKIGELNEAVRLGRMAVAELSDGHPDHGGCLSNLSVALLSRFDRLGAAADLDEAVSLARQAVAATPEGHRKYAIRWSYLAIALHGRFGRTNEIEDLEAAIAAGRQAVKATAINHPHRAGRLTNLAYMLAAWFERTDVGSLDEAVHLGREAAAITPAHHSDRAAVLANLGNTLSTLADRTGAVEDLNEATMVSREALASVPDGHPDRASMLCNLSAALATRFETLRVAGDLDEAIHGWVEASQSSVAPAMVRLSAAKSWAHAVVQRSGPAAAAEPYTEAVKLLPLLTWRGISHRDQQYLLQTQSVSLARDGAACAIAAGSPDLAATLLYAGCGVYWSQVLSTRIDLTDLHHVAPDLAEQLSNCRAALDRSTLDAIQKWRL
ncbi:tetratricopeptide repeat protein [Verrucosispora sp. WMMD573]|uniref:tetratricopeptide repeat protein n=1 Tax=Verrucosispora sp. WMMD573 TaxID=3015149 RepID=UPI00248B73E7|nr:tetratricopeptide repeat protein [Verrucosispora sp. WMMD573]WBB52448.1 tetratricopeptide repeat protein [Verrucosispora sp. WMMD573]